MTKQITLTDAERAELKPLLNITAAEKALMPKDMQEKLDILIKEQDSHYAELDSIVEQSLADCYICQGSCSLESGTKKSKKSIKNIVLHSVKSKIQSAKQKAMRNRHHKSK